MKAEILLDTNFIITCAKQKIDFLEDLKFKGFKILIPKQVINELKKNKAELALKLLGKEKNSFEQIDIGEGHVDKSIIKYAKENKDILVATLDRGIKDFISNKKMIIRGKKKLEVI